MNGSYKGVERADALRAQQPSPRNRPLRKHGTQTAVTEQMELILNNRKDPREAIRAPMLCPGKKER